MPKKLLVARDVVPLYIVLNKRGLGQDMEHSGGFGLEARCDDAIRLAPEVSVSQSAVSVRQVDEDSRSTRKLNKIKG